MSIGRVASCGIPLASSTGAVGAFKNLISLNHRE